MINIILIITLFVILFVLIFLIYYYNPDKLIKYHRYLLVVDIIGWASGIFIIFMGFLFYKYLNSYIYLMWIQIMVGIGLLNIYIARFIIRLMTKKRNKISIFSFSSFCILKPQNKAENIPR